jgi:hypothetical protein
VGDDGQLDAMVGEDLGELVGLDGFATEVGPEVFGDDDDVARQLVRWAALREAFLGLSVC